MVTTRRFGAGEVIVREGEHGETAYILRSGRVEVTISRDGKPVHLATLGPGEIFGEMSMIDEKPRSATVTTLEPTEVSEIHHDQFFATLQTQPQIAGRLLSALFERLREANRIVLQHAKAGAERAVPGGDLARKPAPRSGGPSENVKVVIQAMTPTAFKALSSPRLEVEKFPFKIGRRSDDPLVHNDLSIPDSQPWQVSRHHVALIRLGDRIGVVDRGSRLGAAVDGRRIGGPDGVDGPVFFDGNEGVLALGNAATEWKYKVFLEEG